VVQHNKFSEMLTNVIKRYQNRPIETAHVMEELIAMAKKFKEEADRAPMRDSMRTSWPSMTLLLKMKSRCASLAMRR
jgi:type I site-specific restriction-modification system R (restriction) subunit